MHPVATAVSTVPAPAQVKLSRLTTAAFFLFVLVVSSADLKRITHERIHWAALVSFLLISLPTLVRGTWRVHAPWMGAAALLVSSILLSGWLEPAYAVLEAGKLLIILVALALIFYSHTALARVGFAAFEAAVYLNAAMLATGLFYPGTLASLMAPGRWGTVLNAPGSLARLGLTTLLCGEYLMWSDRRLPLRATLLAACSVLLVYADGSRTGMLLVLLSIPATFAFSFHELRRRSITARAIITAVAIALCLVLAADIRQRVIGADASSRDGLIRIANLWDALSSGDDDPLSTADQSRSEMLAVALEKLHNNPLSGDGIGKTRVDYGSGPMVVHMTYLQVWGDLGVLGLIGYVCYTFVWVPVFPKACKGIRKLGSVHDRALYSNAIFLLAVYCASAFAHPLSTELPEWVPFLLAFPLVDEVSRYSGV